MDYMKTAQRALLYFDWINFFLPTFIASLGLLFIFSATHSSLDTFSIYFTKQIMGIACGLIVYIIFAFADYRTLLRFGYFAYFGIIILLMFTLVKGHIGMGAQRWLHLGLFKLQPSELAKPLFPAFVSYYFFTHHKSNNSWLDYAPVIITLFVSFVLILKQPDLGTALIILFSGLLLLWLAGLSKKFFIIGGILLILAAPALWLVLKPYQRNRITVFFGQGATHKERYQIEQATIAIGSGGLWGKGLLQGSQNKLQFLPESRTDFIFAVICEEWGFMGACAILLLYALLYLRIIICIQALTTRYVQLLAIGLLIPLILSTIINVCMVTSLLPIVGIPLPLMSYGLSNLLISYASLGWLQGICMQHG
jgi:Bacterial cell division membrane protein